MIMKANTIEDSGAHAMPTLVRAPAIQRHSLYEKGLCPAGTHDPHDGDDGSESLIDSDDHHNGGSADNPHSDASCWSTSSSSLGSEAHALLERQRHNQSIWIGDLTSRSSAPRTPSRRQTLQGDIARFSCPLDDSFHAKSWQDDMRPPLILSAQPRQKLRNAGTLRQSCPDVPCRLYPDLSAPELDDDGDSPFGSSYATVKRKDDGDRRPDGRASQTLLRFWNDCDEDVPTDAVEELHPVGPNDDRPRDRTRHDANGAHPSVRNPSRTVVLPTCHAWQVLEDWIARLELRLLSLRMSMKRRKSPTSKCTSETDRRDLEEIRESSAAEVLQYVQGLETAWHDIIAQIIEPFMVDGGGHNQKHHHRNLTTLLRLLNKIMHIYASNEEISVTAMMFVTSVLENCASHVQDDSHLSCGIDFAPSASLMHEILAVTCRSMHQHTCNDYIQSIGVHILYTGFVAASKSPSRNRGGTCEADLMKSFATLCKQGAVELCLKVGSQGAIISQGPGSATQNETKVDDECCAMCDAILTRLYDVAQQRLVQANAPSRRPLRSAHRQSCPPIFLGSMPLLSPEDPQSRDVLQQPSYHHDRSRRQSDPLGRDAGSKLDAEAVADDTNTIHARLVVFRLEDWIQHHV